MQFIQMDLFLLPNTPTVSSVAFYDVPASVMTLETYQNETFGDLNVSKETIIEGGMPPNVNTYIHTNSVKYIYQF